MMLPPATSRCDGQRPAYIHAYGWASPWYPTLKLSDRHHPHQPRRQPTACESSRKPPRQIRQAQSPLSRVTTAIPWPPHCRQSPGDKGSRTPSHRFWHPGRPPPRPSANCRNHTQPTTCPWMSQSSRSPHRPIKWPSTEPCPAPCPQKRTPSWAIHAIQQKQPRPPQGGGKSPLWQGLPPHTRQSRQPGRQLEREAVSLKVRFHWCLGSCHIQIRGCLI